MTIVSGLLGIRPKRAPPGMHRSIGRFGSYDGIEPLRVSQVLRNGVLVQWDSRSGQCPRTRTSKDLVWPR
jgi:hypothetical protein